MPVASTPGASDLSHARAALDQWVRDLMQWHFSPDTGCPFWLDWAARAGWDPRREVQAYDDLDKFDAFQDEWLRGGDARRWVPKGYTGRPVYVFETGGSTGVPKSRINIDDFRIDYSTFSETLPDQYFPKGADWLEIGPSGPRRLRLAIEHLAQHRGGICYMVDLDPRWVIKLIRMGDIEMVELYKRHVIDQALTLLKAHDTIKCLFTTQAARALCERDLLKKAGITGVFCGSTDDAQFHRFAGRGADGRRPLRADLRQHADGPRPAQAADEGRQLGDHLLPAGAAGDDRGRRSRQPVEGRRVRQDRPRAAHHPHQGVPHAALPRARRVRARSAVRTISVGRRGRMSIPSRGSRSRSSKVR
jgi:hypothetical protein